MSPAPQAEECQQRVDDEIALDSTFLLRKVVHKALELSYARAREGKSRGFIRQVCCCHSE